MSTNTGWVLAFDIGGTSTKVALVSSTGEMRGWASFPTKPPRDAYLDRLADTLRGLAAKTSVPLVGMSGAIAGFLSGTGSLLYNPNLLWLEQTDLRSALSAQVQLPLTLENDANAACAGEYRFGAGQGSQRFLCLTGGTGLGGGMIVDGRILHPAFGGLGDAGHVIVVPSGPPCSCGGRGCAEVLLSSFALAAQFSEVTGRPRTFRSLASHAAAGDRDALHIVQKAGHHLGVALASLAHIFFPDRIAIAGGLSVLGEPLLLATRTSFTTHAGTFPASLATIDLARTGAHAGLQGAAASLWLIHSDL